MIHNKGSARQQRLSKVGRAIRATAKCKRTPGDFWRYETLKSSLAGADKASLANQSQGCDRG